MSDLLAAFRNAVKLHRPAAVTHTLYRGYEAQPITEEIFETALTLIITDNIANGGIIHVVDKQAALAVGEALYTSLGFSQDRHFQPPSFMIKREKPEPVINRKTKLKPKPLTRVRKKPKL